MLGGFWGRVGAVGAGKLAYAASLLGAELALARLLSPKAFGTYKQVWEVFYRPLVPLATLGVPAALFYFYPRTPEQERGRLMVTAGGTLLASGALVALSLFLLSPFFSSSLGNPYLQDLLRPFSLYIGAMIASAFIEPFLLSSEKIKILLALSLMHSFSLACILIFPVDLGYGLGGAFRWLCLLSVGRMAFVWIYGIRGAARGLRNRPVFGPLMRYALPLGLSTALGGLSIWVDKAVVSLFYPPAVAGVYMVGAREVPFVPIFLGSVSSVLSAELNRRHGEGPEAMVAIWGRAALKVGAAVFPLFLFLFAFAGKLLPWAFGDGFSGAVLPFRLYLGMLPLRAAAYGPLVAALGRPNLVLVGVVGDLVGNAGLSLFLVPRVGPWGAAFATSLMTYLHVAFLLWAICRLSGLPLSRLLPWSGMARTAGCGLLGLGASLPFLTLNFPFLSIATGAGAFGVVYLLALKLWTGERM